MGKLLVVDDEIIVRDCVSASLLGMGYDVVEAMDGIEALQIVKTLQSEISMILMDIDMPRMDGITAAKLMKGTDPSAKIILMSGRFEQVLTDGIVDAFLPKPLGRKALSAVVQRLIGEQPVSPRGTLGAFVMVS
jgi:CheY-like chemotaxis protein